MYVWIVLLLVFETLANFITITKRHYCNLVLLHDFQTVDPLHALSCGAWGSCKGKGQENGQEGHLKTFTNKSLKMFKGICRWVEGTKSSQMEWQQVLKNIHHSNLVALPSYPLNKLTNTPQQQNNRHPLQVFFNKNPLTTAPAKLQPSTSSPLASRSSSHPWA